MRVGGARIEQKEGTFRLMAYAGNNIDLTTIDAEDEVEKFPQDSFHAISLEEAIEKTKRRGVLVTISTRLRTIMQVRLGIGVSVRFRASARVSTHMK